MESARQDLVAHVPHTKLALYKGHQNLVKVSSKHHEFTSGKVQFKHNAVQYINLIEEAVLGVAWRPGSHVVLDVGCGVASFGGFLFDRDVLTMLLVPKDEHKAHVQFKLEQGIPAISDRHVNQEPPGTFNAVHCARCRVPFHIEGKKLLLKVNRYSAALQLLRGPQHRMVSTRTKMASHKY
ncbi:hypothetical protein E2562_036363 [Oryza meyeriana var. granulata]|uniref:Methyltransferase n=1 Tax=Oryza meyeriana var. granulata TaxID=110450 RepID=A0A6G1FG52_9ORYZ|nr:hypothetical protein E2562_036363 [Oryza meyeriana var. granulata]